MVCLGNCDICGRGTMNSATCKDCEKETTRRVMANEPTDEKSIKDAVEKQCSARQDREMEEHLARLAEDSGRDNWRSYMNERNEAFTVIDKAIEMIESYGEDIPEMQSLKKILDSVDTGREREAKFKKAKKSLSSIFKNANVIKDADLSLNIGEDNGS